MEGGVYLSETHLVSKGASVRLSAKLLNYSGPLKVIDRWRSFGSGRLAYAPATFRESPGLQKSPLYRFHLAKRCFRHTLLEHLDYVRIWAVFGYTAAPLLMAVLTYCCLRSTAHRTDSILLTRMHEDLMEHERATQGALHARASGGPTPIAGPVCTR